MKKKNIIILIIVALLAVGALITGFAGLLLHFWYYQTHTGSRSGRVIDAITGKPIEGAVVTYAWQFGGFMGIVDESSATLYETVTDKEGKYFIPNQRVKRDTTFQGSLRPESILIYKDNYAVYKVYSGYEKPRLGSSFGYPYEKQEYLEENNIVKLYPWKSGESHYKHMGWIKNTTPYYTSELLKKELKEEEKRADEEGIVW